MVLKMPCASFRSRTNANHINDRLKTLDIELPSWMPRLNN
jgi:hypothetical protein